MRLIDANDLIDWFESLAHDDWNKGTGTTWASAFEESANMVDGAPTIDAVPVVRCEDCKWNDKHDKRCKVWNHGVLSIGYCYRGEEREDETAD